MQRTNAVDAEVIALIEAGIPYGTIGERVGMSRQAVAQRAWKAGIHRNPNKGIALLKDPETRQAARARWLREKAQRAAAKATDLLNEAAQMDFDRLANGRTGRL
jgi:hypothetical protein